MCYVNADLASIYLSSADISLPTVRGLLIELVKALIQPGVFADKSTCVQIHESSRWLRVREYMYIAQKVTVYLECQVNSTIVFLRESIASQLADIKLELGMYPLITRRNLILTLHINVPTLALTTFGLGFIFSQM